MASDWRALRYLAAVALERNIHPTSHTRDPHSDDEKALHKQSNGVCIQMFVFESLTNCTSRACTPFHRLPEILHSQETQTWGFPINRTGELCPFLAERLLLKLIFQILSIEGVYVPRTY